MKTRQLKIAAALVVGLCAPGAGAAPVPQLDVERLWRESDSVVAGSIVSIVDTGIVLLGGGDFAVRAHRFSGLIEVERVLKGALGSSVVPVVFDIPEVHNGYGDVPQNAYRAFFLVSKNDHHEFTSPYWPAVMAVPSQRQPSAGGLRELADLVAAVLTNASTTESDRKLAVMALRTIRIDTADEALRGALRDANVAVAVGAAAALIERGDVTGVRFAAAALSDPDRRTPEHLLRNLRGNLTNVLTNPTAAPEVLVLLDSRDVETRRAAVSALRNMQSASLIRDLVRALDDTDNEVRYHATNGLAAVTGEALRSRESFEARSDEHVQYWKTWAARHGVSR